MQPADGVQRGSAGVAERGDVRPWVIKPWVSAPPDIVVYEYGARLDAVPQAAASDQIATSRGPYNDLVAFIRGGRSTGRPCTASSLRASGAPRPRKPTACAARRWRTVWAGLGWATANAVLDSALLAWNRALASGRAPHPGDSDQRNQDSLYLQFPTKGGPPVQRVVDGCSQEIHLELPAAARRRAYGAFAGSRLTWRANSRAPGLEGGQSCHVVRGRLERVLTPRQGGNGGCGAPRP